jgi:predicted small lipoprotein YifL
MKKYLAVFLVFVLVLSLIGCGKEEENEILPSDEEPCESVEDDETIEDGEPSYSEIDIVPDKNPEELLADFIANAEGEWHRNGDTSDVKLTIYTDGTFTMIYEGDAKPYDHGTISYDSDYESIFLDGEEKIYDGNSYSYSCSMMSDDMLDLVGKQCIRAAESFNFRERLTGHWYLDGDTDSRYFKLDGSDWYLSEGGMGSITNVGSENGETYELHFYEM